MLLEIFEVFPSNYANLATNVHVRNIKPLFDVS